MYIIVKNKSHDLSPACSDELDDVWVPQSRGEEYLRPEGLDVGLGHVQHRLHRHGLAVARALEDLPERPRPHPLHLMPHQGATLQR